MKDESWLVVKRMLVIGLGWGVAIRQQGRSEPILQEEGKEGKNRTAKSLLFSHFRI